MTVDGASGNAWLLSSAGRRGSLINLLRSQPIVGSEARIVATDMSELSSAGRLADEFEIVPRATAEGFVTRMLEVCRKRDVAVVIPTIDPEIEVYARAREAFAAEGIDVWVSSPEVALLGWDKWALYRWLKQHDLPTVETYEVKSLPFGALSGPVVAKPRSGSSSIGVMFADSQQQLDLADLDDSYIVQERAEGVEVTVDIAIGVSGRILAVVPRRRIEVRGGEVSKGVTVDYPAVIETVARVAELLPGARGALNVQVFFDARTSTVKIIEINPRFGGGYPLSHLAGANFFDALLRDSRGEHVEMLSWEPGTLMLRYDAEVVVRGFDIGSLDV